MAVNTVQQNLWLVQEINGTISKIFTESAKRRVAKDVGLKIFKVEEDKNYASSYQMLGVIGWPKKVAEGEDYPETMMDLGYKKIVTQNHFASSFKVTKDMRLFISGKWKDVQKMPKDLVRSAFNAIDKSYADVLNNGWATSYTDVYGESADGTGADGVALFSASHRISATGSLFTNIITGLKKGDTNNTQVANPKLNRQAIVDAMVMAASATDSKGNLSPIELDTLLVSFADYDEALRIVNSTQINASPNNDTNPRETVHGLKVVVWNRLDAGKWFMYDSEMIEETLMSGFAQRPKLSQPSSFPQNENWIYTMDYYYYIQLGYPGFIYGSNGNES